MADAQAASSASSNGVGDKKRRDVSWLDTQTTSASSGSKKLKIEPESLPEVRLSSKLNEMSSPWARTDN